MANKPYKIVPLSRPQDKFLEAYKEWIMEIAKRLTTGPTTVK